MSKTYSKKQKWIEFNVNVGIGRPVFGNSNYRSNFERPRLATVEEKMSRHPNKTSKKSNLRKELYLALGPCYPEAYCRNSCGEIYDRSSRRHLIKRGSMRTRRAIIKKETQKLINEIYD